MVNTDGASGDKENAAEKAKLRGPALNCKERFWFAPSLNERFSKVARPAEADTTFVPTIVEEGVDLSKVTDRDESNPVVTRLPRLSITSTATGDIVTPDVAATGCVTIRKAKATP
jgi:hypothetical protein